MRAPPLGGPYLTETQYSRTTPLQPATVLNVHYTQQGYHRPANDTSMVHRTLNHQSYPPTGGYYVANSQQPYFTGGVAREMHGPYSRTIVESVLHDYQVTNMGKQQYHQLPPLQRQPIYKDNNVVAYNAYQQAPTQYASSVAQPASGLYTSSVAQPVRLYMLHQLCNHSIPRLEVTIHIRV